MGEVSSSCLVCMYSTAMLLSPQNELDQIVKLGFGPQALGQNYCSPAAENTDLVISLLNCIIVVQHGNFVLAGFIFDIKALGQNTLGITCPG